MAHKPKFYVTVVADCPACEGTGSDYGAPCTDCQGTGTGEDAIELVEALTLLGILTRLEQVERTAGRAMQYADGLANGGI